MCGTILWAAPRPGLFLPFPFVKSAISWMLIREMPADQLGGAVRHAEKGLVGVGGGPRLHRARTVSTTIETLPEIPSLRIRRRLQTKGEHDHVDHSSARATGDKSDPRGFLHLQIDRRDWLRRPRGECWNFDTRSASTSTRTLCRRLLSDWAALCSHLAPVG